MPPSIEKMVWHAEWIWRKDETRPQNAYLYARKTFELHDAVRKALAHCVADSRYKLFVNRRFVGRGPARSDPRWQRYDTYDLSKLLEPGINVVAMLVHHLGVGSASYVLGRAGLLFQCDVVCTNGELMQVKTDSTWRVKQCEAWAGDAPRIHPQAGFAEVYDARLAMDGWESPDLDDSDWEKPQVIGKPPRRPWVQLSPRDIPDLKEEEHFPARTLDAKESARALPATGDRAERQAEGPTASAAPEPRIDYPQRMLKKGGPPAIVLPSAGGASASVALDFGKEVSGHLRVKISGPAGAVIDASYSEWPDRSAAVSGGLEWADRYVLRDGAQTWETFDRRGFRYLKLAFGNSRRPIRVQSVSVNQTAYPVALRGSFACSNRMLTRIWELGRDTLALCMADTYESCPARERAMCWADARIAALANYYAFGDTALVARGLRLIGQSQQPDGAICGAYPSDPATVVPDLALIWVSSLWEYYLYSADEGLLEELYPRVRRLLSWFRRRLSADALVGQTGHVPFIDDADLDREGEVAALNAFYVAALVDASRIASVLGDDKSASEYARKRETVRSSINQCFWDDAQGAYVDSRSGGIQSASVSAQTNALMLLYGIVPAERRARLFSLFYGDDQGLAGIQTPYFTFYVLEALFRHGRAPLALSLMRSRWKKMLDQDATACWEHFHPGGCLCRAWSVAPTFELSSRLLGVSPEEPGYRSVRIAPQPCNITHAQGTVPCPAGDIAVSWRKDPDDHQFEVKVTVPPGLAAEIGVPRLGMKYPEVTLNGESVWRNEKLLPNPFAHKVVAERQHIFFALGRGGTYTFSSFER